MFKFTWHKNQCIRSINLTFLVAVQHRLKRASDSSVNWSETLSRWPWTSEPSLLFSPAFKNIWLFWGSVCSKNIEHIDQHFYSISEWCLYEKRIIQFSLCFLLDRFDFEALILTVTFFSSYTYLIAKENWFMGGSNRSGNGNDQALNLLFFCGHWRSSAIASRICLKSFRAKPPLPSEKKSPLIHLSDAEESIRDSVRTLLLIIDLQIQKWQGPHACECEDCH